MSIGKRLRAARELRGMSQDQLAAKAGVSQGAIHKIEQFSVATKNPVEIAMALNIDPVWLSTGKGISPFSKGMQYLHAVLQVPVLEWQEVSLYIKQKDKKLMENRRYISIVDECSTKSFAVKIKGDSMTANHGAKKSFLDGDILIADPEKQASNEDYVIAYQDGNADNIVLRQYIADGQNIYLRALNPAYEKINVDNNVIIYAVIVSHYSKL
jgi:SOS-response transcriptional repressor LexA